MKIKYFCLISLIAWIILLSWCSAPKENILTPKISSGGNQIDFSLPELSWDYADIVPSNLSNIVSGDLSDLVPENLSWTVNIVKWYAKSYYNDELSWYVWLAKEWLSWVVQNIKNQYNEWIEKLSDSVSDNISKAVSDKLNTLKF